MSTEEITLFLSDKKDQAKRSHGSCYFPRGTLDEIIERLSSLEHRIKAMEEQLHDRQTV